jgi:hypothetical protein
MRAASAAMAGGHCKKVHAKVGTGEYLEPPNCTFQGVDYEGCIATPVKGKLKGTWWYYFSFDNFVEVLDPWPNHPGFQAIWGLSSIVTKKGEIWMRDSVMVDIEDVADFGFFVQTSVITGGTGDYAGATGRLGYVGSEDEGFFRGWICKNK